MIKKILLLVSVNLTEIKASYNQGQLQTQYVQNQNGGFVQIGQTPQQYSPPQTIIVHTNQQTPVEEKGFFGHLWDGICSLIKGWLYFVLFLFILMIIGVVVIMYSYSTMSDEDKKKISDQINENQKNK